MFMQFNVLVEQVICEQVEGITELAQQFYKEFLSKHQPNKVGSHNCAWATQEFIRWAKEKGISAQAIYFVWPKEEVVAKLKQTGMLSPGFADAGESHIAPVVKNKIIDFTYKQFDNNFNQPAKITDVSSWQNVYGKYGYGSRTVNVGGKNTPVIVDTFDKIKNIKEIGGISSIYPSKPLDKPLASRVSIGSDEVRNIAQTGKVTSRGPYKGHTFFYDNPDPKAKYLTGLYDTHGQGPLKPGQKMGYVLRGDKSKMTTPEKGFMGGSEGYYQRKGYMTLPPGSEAGDIKSLQRIKYPQSHWEQPTLGKERDFNRFMQIYNKLSDAFKKGKIQVPPPRITPGAGAAGIASLMQFLNTEVPPDVKNSMLAGGGLGIKGKFEATP